MKRILLVDDDALVRDVYQDGLSRLGFEVVTAEDGLSGMKALHAERPDLVILDLMMPKLSGVEVLKFIRGQPKLADLPVIVLSNSYAEDVAREAANVGAQKGLLKISCSPPLLGSIINEILEGAPTTEDESHLLAAPTIQLSPAQTGIPPVPTPPSIPAPSLPFTLPMAAAAPRRTEGNAPDGPARARHEFLAKAKETCDGLRRLFEAFSQAATEKERAARLQDLYRKVSFISAAAGMAQCLQIAQMASALEALLFGLMDKPSWLTPSVLNTIANVADFLEELFARAEDSTAGPLPRADVLVVDDDMLSNRLVVSALRNAQVQAFSTQDPVAGLRMLATRYYDLILLDVEMPVMDGFGFCQRLRMLPGYERTPVIFVTLHSDPETRARTFESGGSDFITKPILPSELAVKVAMHLLRRQEPG